MVQVKAFFVEVNELQNRMILSQKQVQQTQLLQEVKEGDVVEVSVESSVCLPVAPYCSCWAALPV